MTTQPTNPEYVFMKQKIQQVKEKLKKSVTFSYECPLLNQQQYQTIISQIFNSMKSINPQQKDLTQYDQIILGKIQGKIANTNFKPIIQQIIGEIPQEKLTKYLKEKTQQKNYGQIIKDKNGSIKQVKKIQLLKKYFDVNLITKRRRHNNLYRTYIRSLTTFIELYEKVESDTDETNISKAFQKYQDFSKEQKKYIQLCKELDALEQPGMKEAQGLVEQQRATEMKNNPFSIATQNIIQQNIPIQQERKIQQIKFVQNNVEGLKNSQQEKAKKTSTATQEVKRTPVKSRRTTKKGTNAPASSQNNANNNQNAEKQLKQSSPKTQQGQSKAQKTQKKNAEKEKTLKKSSFMSLDSFFKKKPVVSQQPEKKIINLIFNNEKQRQNNGVIQPINKCIQQIQQQSKQRTSTPAKIMSVWDSFSLQQPQQLSQKVSMSQLRTQFKSFKMQNQQTPNQSYYLNMVITLSTIEYYDYYIKLNRQIAFAKPFSKMPDVFYFQDQSEQFEGESACEDQIQQQEDQDDQRLSSGNNTILDDDHLSFEEISSCDSHEMEIKVEYGKGMKWIYNFSHMETSQKSEKVQEMMVQFQMVYLEDKNQKMPLRLFQQEQKNQLIMTPQIWRQVYKICHGNLGSKDNIIKDLSQILPSVSKTWIDLMLRQRSQKIGNQRFIKKDFIQDLKQKIPQIEQTLNKVLQQRNYELKKIRDQKNYQRDQKLQIDILQYEGSYFIVNLLKYLRQKGYKQFRRTQLLEFINQRTGEKWDKIKEEINTMPKPVKEKKVIKEFNGEKIDEEVQVDDEEFNRVEGGERIIQEKEKQNSGIICENDKVTPGNSIQKQSVSSQHMNQKPKSFNDKKNTLLMYFNKVDKHIPIFKDQPDNKKQQKSQKQTILKMFQSSKKLSSNPQQKQINLSAQQQQQVILQMQKKQRLQKQKEKRKRRQQVDTSYYLKTQPIHKQRRTKNSLKTGILSLEEEKRIRKQQYQRRKGQMKDNQGEDQENSGQQEEKQQIDCQQIIQQQNQQKALSISQQQIKPTSTSSDKQSIQKINQNNHFHQDDHDINNSKFQQQYQSKILQTNDKLKIHKDYQISEEQNKQQQQEQKIQVSEFIHHLHQQENDQNNKMEINQQ